MTASKLQIEVQHLVKAPAEDVYNVIVDYKNHHPHILPGGVLRIHRRAGRVRQRHYLPRRDEARRQEALAPDDR